MTSTSAWMAPSARQKATCGPVLAAAGVVALAEVAGADAVVFVVAVAVALAVPAAGAVVLALAAPVGAAAGFGVATTTQEQGSSGLGHRGLFS